MTRPERPSRERKGGRENSVSAEIWRTPRDLDTVKAAKTY
jgi:hypothetical protein